MRDVYVAGMDHTLLGHPSTEGDEQKSIPIRFINEVGKAM